MKDSKKPLLILGGGGNARVLIDALKYTQHEIIGITDPDENLHGREIMGIPVIGNDEVITQYPQNSVQLVNGIGSVSSTSHRRLLFEKFKNHAYFFASVIHPSAMLASDAEISEGIQIMAGAIVQTGCHIGQNSIINTRASIDHDCRIGMHCHLAPGVILSGEVSIADETHIGAGAVIIQGIDVGSNCLVAAGSVVVKNIGNNVKVKGAPANEG